MRTILSAALIALCLGSAAPASADGMLTFVIDGDTLTNPFKIINSSTANEKVVSFGFNVGAAGLQFDTVVGGNNTTFATPFTVVAGGAATGFSGPNSVADGATFLQLFFSDFNPGESFSFDIDVDGARTSNNTVFGNELIGATAFVDFSSGLRATGVLSAVPGNPDASSFSITSVTPTPDVPEPATWATMFVGLLLAGVGLRRRVPTGRPANA